MRQFFLDEAEYSSNDETDSDLEPTSSDDDFIDDSDAEEVIDPFKIEDEHKKNLKRIAKNLEEFEDSLSFNYTDRESLKAFILLKL